MTLMTLTTSIITTEIRLMIAEKMHTTKAVCKAILLKLKVQEAWAEPKSQAKANDCLQQSFRLSMKL
jgi:hypothetical protein